MNLANKWLVGSISAALIAGAVHWEGTKYNAYDDVVGVVTVCHGYTGKDINKNKKYTPQECKFLLEKELVIHAAGVLKCVNVPLTQYQYDAFVLFTYNVGVNAFCTSNSVLKPLNQGRYTEACNGLLRWVYADGKYSKGLYNRRLYERSMCLGEMNVSKVLAPLSRDSRYYINTGYFP